MDPIPEGPSTSRMHGQHRFQPSEGIPPQPPSISPRNPVAWTVRATGASPHEFEIAAMRSRVTSCSIILLLVAHATAEPPAGYYDSVDETNASTLRATVHNVIDDHTRFPYTASGTDTWDILDDLPHYSWTPR